VAVRGDANDAALLLLVDADGVMENAFALLAPAMERSRRRSSSSSLVKSESSATKDIV
jgi:hypothetical protein